MNVNYNIALKCIVWCRMYIYKHWLLCNYNITSNRRHLSYLIQSQLNAWKRGELSKLKGLVFLDSNRLTTALVSCNKMVKLIPTDWCSNTFVFFFNYYPNVAVDTSMLFTCLEEIVAATRQMFYLCCLFNTVLVQWWLALFWLECFKPYDFKCT